MTSQNFFFTLKIKYIFGPLNISIFF